MRTRITRSMIGQSTGQGEGGGTGMLILVQVCVYQTSIWTDLATFGSTNSRTRISHANIGESAG